MSVVIVTERDVLKDAIREVLAEFGGLERLGMGAPAPVAVADEVPTGIARRMLAEKGYSVKSFDGLRSVLERHGVAGVMRGRVMWYKGREIDAIPAMR